MPRFGPTRSESFIVKIRDATFYRNHPSSTEAGAGANFPMFPRLNFTIRSEQHDQHHWAIIGPSNAGKTTFFEILRGKHICVPSTARSFPYLTSKEVEFKNAQYSNPARAIQYVGFDGERGGVGKAGTRGAYLSARYESRREDTDFSVMDYLRGDIDLNPSGGQKSRHISDESLDKVIADLELESLVNMPMGNLSNGQTRRARIARALLGKPLVLLLDEPFMGLDPPTIKALQSLLGNLTKTNSVPLLLALRPQDELPYWISHLIHLDPGFEIAYQGDKGSAATSIDRSNAERDRRQPALPIAVSEGRDFMPVEHWLKREPFPVSVQKGIGQSDEILVEMRGVCVRYGEKSALGGWKTEIDGNEREGLYWTVKRGERWGVFGPNGSGKTTLLSLICSDHPQAYSLPIKIFGRGRLPQKGQPGISVFDIQARIGQSSPEIHAFFPRNLSLRQTIQNAWADTFLGTPKVTIQKIASVEACLRWFEAELNPTFIASQTKTDRGDPTTSQTMQNVGSKTDWADNIRFSDAPFSAQRVSLLLRAIIKKPDLVVLDEALSGMDPYVRDKCMLFLTWGERKTLVKSTSGKHHVVDTESELLSKEGFGGLDKNQALICVSHVQDEVPGIVRDWIRLPQSTSGHAPRFGRVSGTLPWQSIWDS